MTERPSSPRPEPDALWRRVREAVARERGPRAWLRSRPTPLRVALAVLVAAAVGGVVVAVAPRRDLATASPARLAWALEAALLWTGVLALAALLLRPLGRPAPRRGRVAAAAGAGLLLPALLVAAAADGGGEGGGVLGPASMCLGLGVAFALPVVACLALLARHDRPGAGHAILLGAAGGLAGNLGLLLHCPRTAPAHLLLGHATVPLALLALLALATALRRPRARGPSSRQGEPPNTR